MSEHTIRGRKQVLFALCAWAPASSECTLGDYDVTEVDLRDISEYLMYLRNRKGLWHNHPYRREEYTPGHLQESSVQAYLRIIKTFFNWLHRRLRRKGINVENPVADLSATNPQSGDPQALTLEEEVAVLKAAKRKGVREYALVLFFIDTACRISEAVVTPDDLDFNYNVAIIEGKGRRLRFLLFTELTAEAIREYLDSPEREQWVKKYPHDTHYVFLGCHGHLTDAGMRYIIRQVGEEAGMELQPHQLRHTMAVTAFEKGAPDAIVSKLMGHRSVKTTVDIYGIFELRRLKQQHEIYSPVAQVAEIFCEDFSGADEVILC